MKVTLTAINKKERISTKTGKPFISLGIKTEQFGDKWLSGFENEQNQNWQKGDEVEIETQTKGEYLNFTVPKNTSAATRAQTDPTNAQPSQAEIKNIINFDVIKRLDRLQASIDQFEYLLSKAAGANPDAIDKAFDKVGPEDSPF